MNEKKQNYYRMLFEAVEKLAEDDKAFQEFLKNYEKFKEELKNYRDISDYYFILEACRYRGIPIELDNRLKKDMAIFVLMADMKIRDAYTWSIREWLYYFMRYYELKFKNEDTNLP